MLSSKTPPPTERVSLAVRIAHNSDVEQGSAIDSHDNDEDTKKQHISRIQFFKSFVWVRSFIFLAILYSLGLSLVISLFRRLPPLEELIVTTAAFATDDSDSVPIHTNLKLEIPHSIDELREVRATLEAYRQAYSSEVMALLVFTYLFLQTFMIPGPLGINILAGSLYPFSTAMLFTAVVSTIGASLNYFLVKYLLKDIVTVLFPQRVAGFQAEVAKHRAHLLNFMIFIRVTPVLPHWFVNLASPIVGIPFHIFLIATALGHQPMNFITVQAGAAISTIHSIHDFYSLRNIAFLMAVGVLALIPVIWKKRAINNKKGTASSMQHDRRKSEHQRIPVLPVLDASSMMMIKDER